MEIEQAELLTLIEQSRAGDREAQARLIEACQDRVYYHCKKLLKNEDDALDATQDVLITVLTGLDKLREPAAFWGWVGGIAANRCRHQLSRGGREFQFTEDEDGGSMLDDLEELDEQHIPEKALDNEETRRMVMEMVDALPPDQRACVLLYYYDEMSVKQIADALGVAEGTVKSRLNYARKSIKTETQKLEKHGIKLYSLAPFLLFFFRKSAGLEKLSSTAAAAVRQNVLASAGSAATAAVGAGTAGSAGAAAQGTAAAAKGAGLLGSMTAKIVAGVAAGALVIGGTAFVATRQAAPPPPDEPPAVTETSPAEQSAPPSPGDLFTFPDLIPDNTPRRTTLDTGNPFAELYMETPRFQEISDSYRRINAYFDDMHTDFAAKTYQDVAWFLEQSGGATEDDHYFYNIRYELKGQDEHAVSVQLMTQFYAGRTMFGATTYRTFDVKTGELLELRDLVAGSEEEIMAQVHQAIQATEYADREAQFPAAYGGSFYYADGQVWYAWSIAAPRDLVVPIPLQPVWSEDH